MKSFYGKITILTVWICAGISQRGNASHIAGPDGDTVRNFEVITIDIGDCLMPYYQKDSALCYFTSEAEVNAELDKWKCGKPELPEGLDFTKYSLLLIDYHGADCKSRYTFDGLIDSVTGTYTFISNVFYGGCRAGGFFFHAWVVIPRLPDGYKVHYARRLIDTVQNKDQQEVVKMYKKQE